MPTSLVNYNNSKNNQAEPTRTTSQKRQASVRKHLPYPTPGGAELSEIQLTILRLLVEYRFLTSGQLHTKLGLKWPTQTSRQARRLSEYKLIESFPYQKMRGKKSEHCYLITARGIHVLEEVDQVQIGYNSQFRHHPTPERIQFRAVELELERQVKQVANGWKLIWPRPHNQYQPLPIHTRQYKALAHTLTLIEQKRYPGRVIDPNGPHTSAVPLKANEYVAQNHNKTRSVVLLLCPASATRRFWQARLKKYGRLARELPVMAVFSDQAKANLYQPILAETKLVIVRVEKVGAYLNELQL